MTYKEFCEKHNVIVSACVGNLTRPDDGSRDAAWDAQATHHMVTLSAGDKVLWSGWYSMGIGHAIEWATTRKNLHKFKPHSSTRYALEDMARGKKSKYGNFKQWFTDEVRTAACAHMKPDADDVLMSLAMDSGDCDQNFEDWASDLGCDTDSRSAYKIWESCNEIRRTLRDSLGTELFNELLECEE